MEKEIKSCMGVLLRADLRADGLGWPCPVRSALLKRTPVQDFYSFSIMFYHIISTTYKKIGNLFCSVHISGLSHSVIGPSCFDKSHYLQLKLLSGKNVRAWDSMDFT